MNKKWKLDLESRLLLNSFRSDKRLRVIKAYRSKDFDMLNKAVGRYRKVERIWEGEIVSFQISQKTY